MGIFPECMMSMHYMCAVPTDAKRGYVFYNWSYRCLRAAICVKLQEQAVPLPAKPPLQTFLF